jgi:hypothetical protein
MRMSRLFGGASHYAHLAGLVPAGRRAEDDDQDDKQSKRSRADDDDDDEPKGKKSRRADDDDDEQDKSGKRSRADDEDDDGPKGKKSRRADDDDDDDDDDKDEMHGRSAAANARRRERARCAAIFGHEAAAQNVALAASLAFETTMTRREAIAVLKGQAGRGGSSAHDVRDGRSRRNPDLGPGGGAPTGQAAVSTLWGKTIEAVTSRKSR